MGEGDLREAADHVSCSIDSVAEPTKHWLQNAMYAEVCRFHPEQLPQKVIQLRPSLVGDDGALSVSCLGISGNVLATIMAQPGQDIAAVREQLSKQLNEPMELIQLLGADGRLLDRCDAEEHKEARAVLAA